jgi:hypothetical protein
VYNELKERTYETIELHSILCSSDKKDEHALEPDPWYRHFTTNKYYPSAVIRKLTENHTVNDSDVLPSSFPEPSTIMERLQRTSNAKVLIAVTFKGTASGFIRQLSADDIKNDFERWFRGSPASVLDLIFTAVRQVTLESLFDSNSCTATWSMPVWLWDCLQPNPCYKYLGVIRSSNYVTLKPPQSFSADSKAAVDSSKVPGSRWALIPAFSDVRPAQTVDSGDGSTIKSLSAMKAPEEPSVTKPPRRESPKDSLPPLAKERSNSRGRRLSGFVPKREKTNSGTPTSQPSPLRPSPASSTPLMIPQQPQLDNVNMDEINLWLNANRGRPPRVEDMVHAISDKKYARRIDNSRPPRGVEKFLNCLFVTMPKSQGPALPVLVGA